MTKSLVAQPSSTSYSSRVWFTSWPGVSISFLWGFAEATFFFVIPDVFLSLAAILGGRRTWTHILAAIAGAVFGGALLFQWSMERPATAHAAVCRVPFIREGMFNKVDDGLRKHGMLAVATGSATGMPYKLYAVEAPRFTTARVFLLATPFVRSFRFLAVWLLSTEISQWLRRRFGMGTSTLLAIHAVVWIAIYAFYWGRIVLG